MVSLNLNSLATEDGDQDALLTTLQFMKNQGKVIAFTHVSNEATYDKAKARKGVSNGFPDLLIVTNRRVIYLELKRASGGITSDEQENWIKMINHVTVDAARVCHGYDQAMAFIKENL